MKTTCFDKCDKCDSIYEQCVYFTIEYLVRDHPFVGDMVNYFCKHPIGSFTIEEFEGDSPENCPLKQKED